MRLNTESPSLNTFVLISMGILLFFVGSVQGQGYIQGIDGEPNSFDRRGNVSVSVTSWTDGNPFLLYTTERANPHILYNNVLFQMWGPPGTPYKIKRDYQGINLSQISDLLPLKAGSLDDQGYNRDLLVFPDQLITRLEVEIGEDPGSVTFVYSYVSIYSTAVPGLDPSSREGDMIPASWLSQDRIKNFAWTILGVGIGIVLSYKSARRIEENRVEVL